MTVRRGDMMGRNGSVIEIFGGDICLVLLLWEGDVVIATDCKSVHLGRRVGRAKGLAIDLRRMELSINW